MFDMYILGFNYLVSPKKRIVPNLLEVALHQLSVLFLEPLTNSFTVLQELFRTLGNTLGFLRSQRSGGKVVDTVVEASRHQVGVKGHEVLHLLLFHDLLELLLFLNVQLIHD